MEEKKRRLSKEEQNKLGVEFDSWEVRVEYNDYCEKIFEYNFDVDVLGKEEMKKIEEDVLKLTNSYDYYHISVSMKYKIIEAAIQHFNYNSYDRKSDEENDWDYISSEYDWYRIENNNKPRTTLLYEEIGDIINSDSILDVNGCFHEDSIQRCIKKLEELKKELSK